MNRSSPIRLLIVDDERDILDLLGSLLQSTTCTVFTALNISEAETLLNSEAIDLIICDYYIGATTGTDWLAKLKKNGNQSHYIVYSGSFDILEMHFPDLGRDFKSVLKTDMKGLTQAIGEVMSERGCKKIS